MAVSETAFGRSTRREDPLGDSEVVVIADGRHHCVDATSLGELLGRSTIDIQRAIAQATAGPPLDGDRVPLPPVDGAMEVWAAGVTYKRSRDARIEESSTGDVYDRVYAAPRPELFHKATAWRVVTDREPIAQRIDSDDNVPEPELGVVFNRFSEIVGYLIVNDMSSRSIEGSNPLYLPQAKTYTASCAVSTSIRPAWEITDPLSLTIEMRIEREGATVFDGAATTAALQRTPVELVEALTHSISFPHGGILATGTSVVPPLDVPTKVGDTVDIRIGGIGRLRNTIVEATPRLADSLWTRATVEPGPLKA